MSCSTTPKYADAISATYADGLRIQSMIVQVQTANLHAWEHGDVSVHSPPGPGHHLDHTRHLVCRSHMGHNEASHGTRVYNNRRLGTRAMLECIVGLNCTRDHLSIRNRHWKMIHLWSGT